ncbi:MAG TPA: metallophosphoesterase [Patescibacteria group bacterium]
MPERKTSLDRKAENKSLVNPVIAFIGDTHVGSPDGKGVTLSSFRNQCEKVSKKKDIDIVVLAGDIWDRNAPQIAVAEGEGYLKGIVDSGKKVILVWGNNEDRIAAKDSEFRNRLKKNGVVVLQDEDRATVVEVKDKKGHKSEIAFVVASRIVTRDEQKAVMANDDKKEQVLINRRFLSSGSPSRLDKFKSCLTSTIRRSVDENGFPKIETLPTVVMFHAPENLSLYQEYRRYAKDRAIVDSEYFTEALTDHQQKYGNIIFGLFGHVEGGAKTYNIDVPGHPPIKYFNACSSVIDGSFSIAA